MPNVESPIPHYQLEGKVAVVTGGGSGIGARVCQRMLESGASVLVNDLDPNKEQTLIQSLTGAIAHPGWKERFAFLAADISDEGAPENLVQEVEGRFGGLDYLFNNAGTAGTKEPIPFSDLDSLSDSLWQNLLGVNLLGPFRMTKAASPLLRVRHGSVVNTASVAGMNGQASSMPYAASKAALINLTQNLARGLAPLIRVNAVAPGLIDTPWTKDWPIERRNGAIEGALLKRLGTPEDIAEVMIFLAVAATFMTGQTVVIDGGR